MKLLAIRAAHAALDLAGNHAQKRWKDASLRNESTPELAKLCYQYSPGRDGFTGVKFGASFTLRPTFRLHKIYPDGGRSDD